MTNALSQMLESRDWILADGATGTNLFNMGLESGDAPEMWNDKHPDRIQKLYSMAVNAGSDLFLTNSFGGNAARLKLHGGQDRMGMVGRLPQLRDGIAQQQVIHGGIAGNRQGIDLLRLKLLRLT